MNKNYPRKSLFDTEDRTIFCSNVGREYHLSVGLPQSYTTSNQKYPVIYLLDGDLNFGMAAGLTTVSHLTQGTPEMIVVGINYDMESIDQFARLRELDFKIPEVIDAPADSYANLFLNALTQEMIPFIEANYRTVPSDRCLYGYSSSGFFVLYALFNEPNAFRHYLSGSGDFDIAYPYLIQHDEKLRVRKTNDPIQLYLSVGGLEENLIPSFHNLISFLKNGKYPGLTLITEIYQGEGHSAEGVALTYLHGIRVMYQVVR
jgi:predicted alpha/beta superfamily hydrolase